MRKLIAVVRFGAALVFALVSTEGFAHEEGCFMGRWCPPGPGTLNFSSCEPADSANSKSKCPHRPTTEEGGCNHEGRWCLAVKGVLSTQQCEPADSAISKSKCPSAAQNHPSSCYVGRWCPEGKGYFNVSQCEPANSANSKRNCAGRR